MWNLKTTGIDDLTQKADIETQTQRTNIWIPRGEVGGGMNWEIWIDIYTIDTMHKTDN